MKRLILCLALSGAALLQWGCHQTDTPKDFDEGRIEYQITYDEATRRSRNTMMLPSALTIDFKEENFRMRMEALSGAVAMSLIKDSEQAQYITAIKIFGRKVKNTQPAVAGQHTPLYATVPPLIVETPPVPCQFMGYNCQRVRARYEGTDTPFDIIYTDEICPLRTTADSPLEQIDGVMLQFRLYLKPLTLCLTAKRVVETDVDEALFSLPADYEEIVYADMASVIEAML